MKECIYSTLVIRRRLVIAFILLAVAYIEFRFYLNFHFFFLKIEATYSIAQIIYSGCNLTAR